MGGFKDEIVGRINRSKTAPTERLDLTGASLAGLRAVNADLPRVCFRNADLTNVRFARANLAYADFEGACVDGADFTGATLTGTILEPRSKAAQTSPGGSLDHW